MAAFNPFRTYRLEGRGNVVQARPNSAKDDSIRVRYGGTKTYAVSNVQSLLVLSENSRRNKVLIQNLSAGTVYVDFGGPADAAKSLAIFSNGNIELEQPTATDSIHVLGTLATQEIRVIEA